MAPFPQRRRRAPIVAVAVIASVVVIAAAVGIVLWAPWSTSSGSDFPGPAMVIVYAHNESDPSLVSAVKADPGVQAVIAVPLDDGVNLPASMGDFDGKPEPLLLVRVSNVAAARRLVQLVTPNPDVLGTKIAPWTASK
jgi:hypothetical protein